MKLVGKDKEGKKIALDEFVEFLDVASEIRKIHISLAIYFETYILQKRELVLEESAIRDFLKEYFEIDKVGIESFQFTLRHATPITKLPHFEDLVDMVCLLLQMKRPIDNLIMG